MEDEIPAVGADLLEHARLNSLQPRGLMDDLFPFIYEASKRLSSRAISRWLEHEKGIKISNVTIAKALRNPDKYWEEFAERMESYIRTVENETNAAAESFLMNEEVLDYLGPDESMRLDYEDAQGDGRGSAEFDGAVHNLKEFWYPLSLATRREIFPYFLGAFPIIEGGKTDES